MIDWAWRLAFRLGFRVMRLWWFVRRPDRDGALVEVWHAERILVVRQSYRQTWTFPGGNILHGEEARRAASRELAEEVGVHVNPDQLRLVHTSSHRWEHCRDHVRIFELHLPAEPRLVIDNREIVAACYQNPETIARLPVPPHIRSYLEQLGYGTVGRATA